MQAFAVFLAMLLTSYSSGCGGSKPAPSASGEPSGKPQIPMQQAEAPDDSVGGKVAHGERTVEATVIEESPTGDGRCTTKSYRIRPTDRSHDPYWVHFENCYGPNAIPAEEEPLGLEVGKAYRFVLRDESGEDLPGPRLISAESL